MRGALARLGLRGRLMAVGLLGVGAALIVGGALLFAVLTAGLERTVANEARSSAQEVAAMAAQGRVPDPVPVSGAQVVQLLDAENRVVGGSATADRLTAIVTADEHARLLTGASLTVPGSRAAMGGRLTVAGVRVGAGPSATLVVAAVPTADVEASRRLIGRLLFIFFPLFVGLLAVVAWRVIGSTLRPVEALRRGAERIGAGPVGVDRLPVPRPHDEIHALATTLNGMLDRIAAAQSRQRDFVADAAHELRSPLASMRTQLEVAARLGEGADLPQGLLPEVERLSTLVDDLLLLARSGAQAAPPDREQVDLGDLAAEAAARAAAGRVPVRVQPAPPDNVPGEHRDGDVPVLASHGELLRAVANLVDNAVRHAATEVVLDVGVCTAGAELRVRDDGDGIPEADRERVFDRFARRDDARDRDHGGSGLGLAIARDLVRRNGGDILLEDASPGLQAVVRLPLAAAAGPADRGGATSG